MDTPLAELNRADLHQLQAADLMRALSAKAFARGAPAEYFLQRWPHAIHRDVIVRAFDPALQQKAAVAAGTTSDVAWAAPLMPAQLVGGFVRLVAQRSAVLRLPLRRVPFDCKVGTQTGDATYGWVGEGRAKAISSLAFGSTALGVAKTSGIVVISKELASLSAPGSVADMQQALVAGLSNFVDGQFLNPAVTAVAGVRPASITNGLVAVTGGTTVSEKVAALVAAFFTALPQASSQSALVMAPSTAGVLAATGHHPQLTIAGGLAFGMTVVTTPAAGTTVVALDPERVLTAREEAPVLDVSDDAAVQMDSAPIDPVTAVAVLVSLWQLDLVGIKCEWALTWKPTPNAVAYTVTA